MTIKDSGIRALLFKSPTATNLARIVKALVARMRMKVHDPDFHALDTIQSEAGLALDIGANAGQSAISILSLKPRFEVVSIEPNPTCRPMLSLLVRLFAGRLRVVYAGAGNVSGQMPFHVPVRSGRQMLEEGTFDPEELNDPPSIERVGRRGVDYQLAQLPCRIIRIDELNLKPIFVKIDVQGFEFEVLQGMGETIRSSRPLIMLERGTDEGRCGTLLGEYGYQRRYWNHGEFIEAPNASCNVFFLPDNCGTGQGYDSQLN